MGTTVHDLSDLVQSYGGKTCCIFRNLISYTQAQCAVICFDSKEARETAICSTPVFKSINLVWAGLSSSKYATCDNFGHIFFGYSDSEKTFGLGFKKRFLCFDLDKRCLVLIYAKKQALVSHSVFFGGTTWASVVSGSPKNLSSTLFIETNMNIGPVGSSISEVAILASCVSVLKHLFENVSDQIANISHKLDRTYNKSTFVILGGDFNEDGNKHSFSFSKCVDFGLVNTLVNSLYIKASTWNNFRGIERTIDFVFISQSLSNALINGQIVDVDEFFNTDYSFVQITIGLGGILDPVLKAICVQANKDKWKFNVKNADGIKWKWYRNVFHENFAMFSNEFANFHCLSDLDSMWCIICKAICFSANEVFSKTWSKGFDSSYTKCFSRFHRLELLVSKLVKASCFVLSDEFVSLLDIWVSLDFINASAVKFLFLLGSYFDAIRSALVKVRKYYHSLKMMESKRARNFQIKLAIDKKMENFRLNKDQIIRNVLERPFHKVILDHLVVNEDLILEPGLVKFHTDRIIEGWTRKHMVVDEFFGVVLDLPDNKAAGLSGISNELWKHCDSKYDVLCSDNFSVLKGMTTQSPIFAIGSVAKDALKKNRELCQVATQHILNIASEFFRLSNILINNDKTVVIPINCRVMAPFLSISNAPISIAKKGVSHHYLGVFLFFDELSKPSLAKAHFDVRFFANLVLKKAISDKQFSYLVSTFKQIQAKGKVAVVVCFTNSVEILGRLFMYRLHDLQKTFKQWKRLNPHGPVFVWFAAAVHHLHIVGSFNVGLSPLVATSVKDILDSHEFRSMHDRLFGLGASDFSVYTNGSLCGLRSMNMKAGAATFFKDINLGLGVEVFGMVFSTLAELQAIALALECVPSSSSVYLFSDSQAALDTCKSELLLLALDFRNKCWVEHWHIAGIIHDRNLNIGWHKIKGHSGVPDNDRADLLAGVFSHSGQLLHFWLKKCFILANGNTVSGNSRHFVHINWFKSFLVWHPNSHMTAGFTSCCSASFCSYFIKALYHRLPVAVRKCLYDRCYPSVICLYCGDIELSDHVFSCMFDMAAWFQLFVDFVSTWRTVFGLSYTSSYVSQMLSNCLADLELVALLCKGFVLVNWCQKATSCFDNSKVAFGKVIEFVHDLCLSFRNDIWLVCSKHCVYIEKHSLILRNGSIFVSVSGNVLLGIDDTFGVSFGLHSFCWFFSGISNSVFAHMSM
ncbi:hypothetical protein G9A89_007713 [Geosiphon pyriformis]|nr:hypothetical protein G9A89_007713 [Geosiphon pyriformis]